MSHFLLVFDRAQSHLLSEKRFNDHREALVERFRAERMHRGNPDIEVVVLSAESKEALRLTHARYFQTVSSLASVKSSLAKKVATHVSKTGRDQ